MLSMFFVQPQAGSLKNKEPATDENIVLCRALRDFNLPKITTQESKDSWLMSMGTTLNFPYMSGIVEFLVQQ